jgi:REP element-mobilizing transposase RayT
VVEECRLICHSICLMGNHYHLLVETPEANISCAMQRLNGQYSQAFNRRHDRVGHLFQGRFKATLVQKESHLLEVSRYIVLNPVRAGIVRSPADWRWSSYRATAGLAPCPRFLTTNWLLRVFHVDRREAQRRYRSFVADGSSFSSPEEIETLPVIGDEEFVKKFQRRAEEVATRRDVLRKELNLVRPDLGDLLDLTGDREERDLRIREAYTGHGYTLAEIAQYLGVHFTTVSKSIKRANAQLNADSKFKV